MNPVVLGIDIGGTRIATGLVTREGQVVSSLSASSRSVDGDAVATLKRVIQHMIGRASAHNCSVAGIGVGAPGMVDFKAGKLRADALKLQELADIPLRDLLEQEYGLPVVLDNDVNAMAMGEMLFGKAQGVNDFLYLALGTGVGGAIVTSGQLLRGTSGFAGEIGHATVQLDGRPCTCGSRGCLKAYAAGPHIVEQAQELQEEGRSSNPFPLQSAADVLLSARRGDPLAQQVVDRVAHALGAALGNLVNIFNPEMIVLGGSVAWGLEFCLDEVKRWAARYALSGAFQTVRIELSAFDKDTAFLGAAALFISDVGMNRTM
ncbi:MAG: ROK family protein [Abditibacteriales bacterium]|nr:ROK family protein [Abditibacteriales bacterium]MDW8365623.1 ROK family protein [Abditibacteriales bacterium]